MESIHYWPLLDLEEGTCQNERLFLTQVCPLAGCFGYDPDLDWTLPWFVVGEHVIFLERVQVLHERTEQYPRGSDMQF